VAYGMWPPETVGRAIARNRLAKLISSGDDLLSAKCIKAADLLIREAVPVAARARRAVRFDELLATAQELLPVYWAAVILFYTAMGIERPFPKDALRDFRVVEEYRVGTLELFTGLGYHLIWRPPFFLHLGPRTGTVLREAMRSALRAARAEISIYPQVMHAVWDEAAESIEGDLPIPEGIEEIFKLEIELQNRADATMSKAFADAETVDTARSLRWFVHSEDVELAQSWRESVWNPDLDPLLREPARDRPIALPGTVSKVTVPTISAREVLEGLLGCPWPSGDSVRDGHL
jgi:hypothetical protein